jgi:plasmid stabilization system protein ParE
MPKPVVTTEQAIVDIANQAGFIAEDNPEAAERYIAAVRAAIASLGDTPLAPLAESPTSNSFTSETWLISKMRA